MNSKTLFTIAFLSLSAIAVSGMVVGHYGPWSDPVDAGSIPGTTVAVNTPNFADGCPIESPDGLELYTATNRSGRGNNDIWRFQRDHVGGPWVRSERLPYPVNDDVANDFCPTPVRGKGLFFVSDRASADSCGGNDIYFARERHDGSWGPAENLGCGINSPAAEWSPSYFEDDHGNAVLYFASTRSGGHTPGGSDADIYFSVNYEGVQLAEGVNTEFNDFRPNVHRTGKEIVFDSDRPGNLGGSGTFDIWTASRENTDADWSSVYHLPHPINTAANETRASFSWDGLRLYFGSTRAGTNDMYFATREKLRGNQR